MASEAREKELLTLKIIAETLNKCNDVTEMLSSVLDELLEVTGLAAGWIFLSEAQRNYECAADCNLPPALTLEDKKPMRQGGCWCLDRYWSGELTNAVNIIECKRLEDAVKLSSGDTRGITHHATVPLKAGTEMFGLLNVASPNKVHFLEDELALLESVAYQIGTAIKRTKLYEAQQNRVKDFSKLDVATRELKKLSDLDTFSEDAAKNIKVAFKFHDVQLFIAGSTLNEIDSDNSLVFEARTKRKIISLQRQDMYHIAIPIINGEEVSGVLAIEMIDNQITSDDILTALAEHLSLAIENVKLHKKQQELTVLEERNRLARDLHDSVSQALFSLSLTTKGAKHLYSNDPVLKDMFESIQLLSHTALSEMRTLIWQLRPPGLEDGVITALKKYGNNLGLLVNVQNEGVATLPKTIEEAIWRIGQECLNNICKHAKTERVELQSMITKHKVRMTVEDLGVGFDSDNVTTSIGLTGMRERTIALGGEFKLESEIGKGTKVTVVLPI
ncbi:histidine kinase [Evansella sp. AB-rgal1]|uniref:GAF domain-containing sensor histidine kinase n=1 Tax=Evansella sp. AB-rgal1 TaxID=3242696 RepID=UPI00359D31AB